MEHISPHGLVIALLQGLFVVFLLWFARRWQRTRRAAGRPADLRVPAILALLLIIEYTVLRVQPARMGGDPWHYTLGIFDGLTLLGIVTLFLFHMWTRQTDQ